MKLPNRVKFIGSKKQPLYQSGMTKNKIYTCAWKDDVEEGDILIQFYKSHSTVTVRDNDGQLHEIEKDDYEVKDYTEVGEE